jgi:hypothetical protein
MHSDDSLSLFASAWEPQHLCKSMPSTSPGAKTSSNSFVVPLFNQEVDGFTTLRRYDLFQCDNPLSQIITSNSTDPKTIATLRYFTLLLYADNSLLPEYLNHARYRRDAVWYLVRSLLVPSTSSEVTKPIVVETAGPPRRHRVHSSIIHIVKA